MGGGFSMMVNHESDGPWGDDMRIRPRLAGTTIAVVARACATTSGQATDKLDLAGVKHAAFAKALSDEGLRIDSRGASLAMGT